MVSKWQQSSSRGFTTDGRKKNNDSDIWFYFVWFAFLWNPIIIIWLVPVGHIIIIIVTQKYPGELVNICRNGMERGHCYCYSCHLCDCQIQTTLAFIHSFVCSFVRIKRLIYSYCYRNKEMFIWNVEYGLLLRVLIIIMNGIKANKPHIELTWNAFIIAENRLLVRYVDHMETGNKRYLHHTIMIIIFALYVVLGSELSIYLNTFPTKCQQTIQHSTVPTICNAIFYHFRIDHTHCAPCLWLFHFRFNFNVVSDPDYFLLYFCEFHVRECINIIFSWNQQQSTTMSVDLIITHFIWNAVESNVK